MTANAAFAFWSTALLRRFTDQLLAIEILYV
jgi:hypothetical protein